MTASFVLVLLLVLLMRKTVFGAALLSVCCAFSLRKAYGKEAGSGENGLFFDRCAFGKGVLCISLGAVLAALCAGRGEGRELWAALNSSLLLADTFFVTLIVFSFGVILLQRRTFGGAGKKKALYYLTSSTVPTAFYALCGCFCSISLENAPAFRLSNAAGHITLAVATAAFLFTAFASCPKRNLKDAGNEEKRQ